MSTLVDFLLARITEDREAAERAQWVDKPIGGHLDTVSDCDCGEHHATSVYLAVDPARMLAECEAKRRVVELHGPSDDPHPFCVGCWEAGGMDGAPSFPCLTLRLLAVPYADHPEFREEWRP